jgi:hypothetical protein
LITNSISLPIPDAQSAQTQWDGSILAINALNTSNTATGQGYGQEVLQILPFSNGTTLPAGSNDTLPLDVTMPGTTTEMTLYDLIFAQTNNLFPVDDASAMDLFGSYSPITITTSTSSSCANALLFYQDILAFPTSTTAVNFQQALNSTYTNANSSSDIDAGVNAFFAGTEQFQNVTFDSWIAVSSYVNAFAFAWANFSSSYTYYIYQSSGQSSATGTPASAKALGTIQFTKPASASNPPAVDDPNGGYTITYNPPSGSPTALTFSSGQLISSLNQDFPTIALQCSYMQLSEFTGNSNDAGTLVPVLCGSLEGQQVLGVNSQVHSSSPGTGQQIQQGIEDFFSSNGIQDFMEITGLIMGLQMVWQGLAWMKSKFTTTKKADGDKDPTKQQSDEIHTEADANMAGAQASQQKVADRLGEGECTVVPQSELASTQSVLTETLELEDSQEAGLAQEVALDEEAVQIEELAEVSVTPELEATANTVNEDMAEEVSAEESGDLSTMQSTVTQVNANIETDSAAIAQTNTADAAEESSQEAAATEQAAAAEKEAEDTEKEDTEAETDVEQGDDVEDLDDSAKVPVEVGE